MQTKALGIRNGVRIDDLTPTTHNRIAPALFSLPSTRRFALVSFSYRPIKTILRPTSLERKLDLEEERDINEFKWKKRRTRRKN